MEIYVKGVTKAMLYVVGGFVFAKPEVLAFQGVYSVTGVAEVRMVG